MSGAGERAEGASGSGRQVPARARVVIVGGGVIGASIAYHHVKSSTW
jgi:hypothetical protein